MKELDFLLNNYFQELKRVSIYFKLTKQKDSFASMIQLPFKNYIIYFSKKDYDKMNSNQIKGVLAHELAHIYDNEKRGFFKSLKETITYLFFDRSKLAVMERRVDMIAIDKGCGEYLLSFMKYHDKRYKKYNKNDGLTKKEIKKLIR